MKLISAIIPSQVSVVRKVLVLGVACLLVGYLLMINHLAIAGHKVQALQTSIQTVQSTSEGVQEAVFQLESLSRIQKEALELEMVDIKDLQFVEVNTVKSVAQK
ncbi:MAG: hypothetical protein HOJ15_02585 [Candidatus Jacksonbacteria bacterium]|jgi:hypothetical protein|nr:hypothetical protein [Candidatus Jacksonbacteria bacterium]MBT6034150.1 hypothetical protein [Candidatus Jacksonbacteria bacterium]MBT6301287.1 hypothetical protein [Candidatus Jacksonbacteria bacterium]MBT6756829.1 hypothetical protein [Candidatus Jacksonbacteria bacterium]MBT6955003.1 hypothetical protein [Candidatus Jacksonbacteria bacterium]